jgi:hypothetical protein
MIGSILEFDGAEVELNFQFQCILAPISDIVFESPKNKSAWINKVLISQSGSSSEDSSLEAWSPSQLTPIADKTGLSSSGSSRNCSGFINKPVKT